jgi:hypothetical protein
MKGTNRHRSESNNVSIAAILSIVGGIVIIIGGISIFSCLDGINLCLMKKAYSLWIV